MSLLRTGSGYIDPPNQIRAHKSGEDSGKFTDDQAALLQGFIADVLEKLNGGLTFGDGTVDALAGNFNIQVLRYTFSSVANTTEEIRHRLGRRPIGRIVIGQDLAASIYDPTGHDWSATSLFLASSVANVTVTFLIL